MFSDEYSGDTDKVNANAIYYAINNTYGQNIDPTKVPEMYLQIQHLQKLIEMTINATPSGEVRNLLCDANIETLALLTP